MRSKALTGQREAGPCTDDAAQALYVFEKEKPEGQEKTRSYGSSIVSRVRNTE